MNMADKGLQNDLYREVSPKKRRRSPLPGVAVALLLAGGAAALYLLPDEGPERVVPMPEGGAAPAVVAGDSASSVIRPAPGPRQRPATPETGSAIQPRQEPGDSARVLIAGFRADEGAVDLQQVVRSADEFLARGMPTDAYLLYFFAARRGAHRAAEVLARMHDPAFFSAQHGVLDQPDLVQAYKWYQQAARSGQAAAQRALNDFRAQVEQRAADGDAEARRLSLQWR